MTAMSSSGCSRPSCSESSAAIAPRVELAASGGRSYLHSMSAAPDIDLTPAAAARVAWIAERQGKKPILRLSVEGGGCAGFSYRFGLAEDVEADDLVADRDGVTLVVDPMTNDLVKGGAGDFVDN